jgi:5-methylcytosine-specific restriction protein A
VGSELRWFGKTQSHAGQKSIASMLKPEGSIYVFYRHDDRAPYTFAGCGNAKVRRANSVPVELTFTFDD